MGLRTISPRPNYRPHGLLLRCVVDQPLTPKRPPIVSTVLISIVQSMAQLQVRSSASPTKFQNQSAQSVLLQCRRSVSYAAGPVVLHCSYPAETEIWTKSP